MAKSSNAKSKMMMAVAEAGADKKVEDKKEPEAGASAMGNIAGALAPADDAKAPEAAAPAPAPAKPKKADGPVKIETKGQLLKALWTSRGAVYIQVDGLDFPLAIVKSVYTDKLKNGDLTEPAVHDLVPRPNPNDGSDLVLRVKAEAE